KALENRALDKGSTAGLVNTLRIVADALEKDDLAAKLQGKEYPFIYGYVSLFGKADKEETSVGAVLCNEVGIEDILSNLNSVSDRLKSTLTKHLMENLFKGTPLEKSFKQFMKERGHDKS